MSKKLYVKCKKCGHYVEVNKKLFAKIIGGTITGFGYWAWVSFLFAGTGFAMPICIAIMAGGVAMVAFSEQIVGWINKMYPCPKCGSKQWQIKTYEEIQQEQKINAQGQTINNQNQTINEQKQTINNQNQTINNQSQTINNQNQTINNQSRTINNQSRTINNQSGIISNYVDGLRDSVDVLIQNMEKGKSNEILNVDQLKKIFHEGIETANEEIDIYVPFLGRVVFETEKFKQEILRALKRGCTVKIRCGFTDNDEEIQKLRSKIDKFISDSRLEDYRKNNQLRFKIDDSHAKLFVVDEKYYVIASMNFLSYDGEGMEYNGKIRQRWEEIGEKSEDINNLLIYRGKYFNF